MQDGKDVPFLRGPGKGRLWDGKNKALTTLLESVSLASSYSSQLSPVRHADAYGGGGCSLKEEQGRRESQIQALKGALCPRKMTSIGIFAVMQQHEWEAYKQEALLFLRRPSNYTFLPLSNWTLGKYAWRIMGGWLPWPSSLYHSSRLFWLSWVLRTHKKGGMCSLETLEVCIRLSWLLEGEISRLLMAVSQVVTFDSHYDEFWGWNV